MNIELTLAQLSDGGFEFGINGAPFAPHTPILARRGDTQLWTVKNSTKWSHPMHLHGFFFHVDSRGDWRSERSLCWAVRSLSFSASCVYW